MKRSKLLRIVLLLLSCVFFQPVLSQNQKIRNYLGEYKIPNIFGINNGYSLKGVAEYQYYDSDDGSRIFNGNFEFNAHRYEEKYHGSGNFKNDKQVGKWAWSGGGDKISMNFNEFGILDGTFEIEYHFKGGLVSTYYGTFANGRLVDIAYYEKSRDGRILLYVKGKYHNGHPIGDWEFSEPNYPGGNHRFTMKYNNYGELIKCGYTNSQTGDWVNWPAYNEEALRFEVRKCLKNYIMRSTPKINNL